MLAEAISIGSNLLSGIFGQSQANKQAKQQAALQREFAQNAVQWKVEDAKKAGVHPLYALGAQTTSYSPVSVGDSLTPALRSAGQDLSRAVHATSPESTRAAAATTAMNALALERGKLENDLLRTQIASQMAKLNQGSSPPMPTAGDRYLIDGQPVGGVKNMPLERINTGKSGVGEGGAIPDLSYSRTNQGWAVAPSKDLQDRMEDDFFGQIAHAIRNRLLPSMGMNWSPPDVPLKPGYRWQFDPVGQQYYQMPKAPWSR